MGSDGKWKLAIGAFTPPISRLQSDFASPPRYVAQGAGTLRIDFQEYALETEVLFFIIPGQIVTWNASYLVAQVVDSLLAPRAALHLGLATILWLPSGCSNSSARRWRPSALYLKFRQGESSNSTCFLKPNA